MAHIVKCKYCSEKFDRDKHEFVEVAPRRYAHVKCYEEMKDNRSQEEIDQEDLDNYIMKLFNEPYVNARIKKQIKDFMAEYPNFTYSGIRKTLIYWYEIKNNSIEKANGGIGIVPFVYNDASKYYYSLYMAQISNENKDLSGFKNNAVVYNIESPITYLKKPKLFNLGDDENEL